MPILTLVRHGQSEWNAQNLFTGWCNPDLTPRGEAEARAAGELLQKLETTYEVAFTSDLLRAQRTLALILEQLAQHPPVHADAALNERDYGELAGLNKDAAREKWGDEQVRIWRRSYATPPPGGESLADTVARVVPYFESEIHPQLAAGKNVLVVAHGNSLRALIKQLENLSDEEITRLEIGTAEPRVYTLSPAGSVQNVQTLHRL